MSRRVTLRTSLASLKAEARRWLKALRANAGDARARLARALGRAPSLPTLRDVQHALAREHGLPGWTALKQRLSPASPMRRYDIVAEALVVAYRTGELEAMRVVWDFFGHGRTWPAMKRYIRLALGRPEAEPDPPDEISLEDARFLVARAQEFETWDALERYVTALPAGRTVIPKAVALYPTATTADDDVAVRSRNWDEALDIMRARRLEALGAHGQMTDAILERVTRLDHITRLDLSGSGALTDDGLRYLSRLPSLRHLSLGGCGRITDAGLEVLPRLPSLETFEIWGARVTDAGATHLAGCDRLRAVDLSHTPSGDGAIRALAGKPDLASFRSGIGVTDAGLALLHEIPRFERWHGGESRMSLTGFDAGPTFLMLRGPFTDVGFRQLVGLDGLFGLNLDDARLSITGAALAPLVDLPHLEWLAFDAKDDSMPFIAALPRLRFLMCQDTSAGDDGFAALGRSRTIAYIWGRRCYNLRRRGFVALSEMPALAHLSVSCRNVDDEGLSALPRFPALRELMPMDVPDDGYRHVGRCQGLETLVLMYCRDTGDVATSHITSLPRLRTYFASYNRITDRTPELLSGSSTLEEVTFDTCTALTNAGVAALARLPRLRRLRVSGMRGVTAEVSAAFPASVRVSHAL
jgi:hypothetical protein